MDRISACFFDNWRIGIGDPSLLAWVTVAVYAVAALLCFAIVAGRRFGPRDPRREAAFWLIAGIILTALALNKQFDLQTVLTATGRCVARDEGWYKQRRFVQYQFIMVSAAAAVTVLLLAALWLRRTLGRTGLPLLGLIFVAGFVVIRAVSLHHVDRLLGYTVATERLRYLLELPGPALVAASALWLLLRRRA